jgi:hypothetical protein
MAPPIEKTMPDVLYIGSRHRKSVGPVFVPDRPFTRSRVIPGFQSHIRERKSSVRAAAIRCGLRLVCVRGQSFDPLGQSLVARSDFAHLLPSVRVLHGLGSKQYFFGARSPATGEQ